MMRYRSVVISLVVLTFIMLGSVSLPGRAASSSPYINYSIFNNTLVINTPFYSITYDASKGGFTVFNITNDLSQEYGLLSNETLPLLGIVANGSLLRNGSIEAIGYSEDNSLIVRITYIIDNNTNITLIMNYYSWTPLIDIIIDASNYTNNLTLILTALREPGYTINTAYTFISSDNNITTTLASGTGVHNINATETPLALALVGLKPTASTNLANSTFFVGLSLDPLAHATSFEISERPATANATIYTLNTSISGPATIHLSLLATNYLPAVLAIPPFALQLGAVANIENSLNIIIQINKYIENLKDHIDQLNNTIEQLRNQTKELQKKLDNYKGCEDHYKQEIKARDSQINQLRERLKKTGAIEAGVFTVGLILGLVGAIYVFNIKK